MTEALFNGSNGTDYYDLTTTYGDEAEINTAFFQTNAATGSSGTGLIQAFVRTQADGNEQGYNTAARPLSYDENSSPQFTTSLKLSDVPVVAIDGVAYYEFRLDINQTNNNPFISLDELKLYKGTSPDPSGLITDASFTSVTDIVWDMDDADLDGADDQDNTVLLDYSLQAGSGRSDMFFYVPVSAFGGADPATTYVTLYSEFGNTGTLDAADGLTNGSGLLASALYGDYFTNDGFEEWSVSKVIGDDYITGYKWDDTNGNGFWDVGEQGIGGWKFDFSYTVGSGKNQVSYNLSVTTSDGLTDVNGDGIADPLGFYAIPVVGNGGKDYTVTITEAYNPLYWINTYDGDADPNGQLEILIDGELIGLPKGRFGYTEKMNFGNFKLFEISGTKYTDFNGNGVVDVEDTGLGGVTIFIDVNGNSLNDDGYSTVTAADGTWSISGLTAAVNGALVKELTPDGYVQTLGPVGTIDATSGNDQTGFDFANYELFEISGTKYTDYDGDGVIDGEDTGLGGVTIFIDVNGNDLNDDGYSSITADDGSWSIDGLDWSVNGALVKEITPDGYVQTLGPATPIVATSGNDQGGFDFANYELFEISGTKYTDYDGDGVIDGEDTGLGGVVIFIDVNGNDLNDDGYSSITADDGTWTIANLDWTVDGALVKEITPDGYVQTLGPVGTIDATSGNDQGGFDFANFENMEISGYKWADANGNALWDEADSAVLEGWTIVLDNDDDPLNGYIAAQVTDAAGHYAFTGLNTIDYPEIAGDADGILHVYELVQNGFTNTYGGFSFEVVSGLTVAGDVGETEEGNFGNYMMAGANRTPGFWQSTLGLSFYDGDPNNDGDANGPKPGGEHSAEDKESEGWTQTDLLVKYGIDTDGDGTNDSFFLWDGNGDGDWDADGNFLLDEGDIILGKDELHSWVSGGEKGGGRDYLQVLERDVGAAFLNTLNNHSLTTPDDTSADPLTGMDALDPTISDSFMAAIEFILKYDGDFDGNATMGKKQQQADWNAYGSGAHNELGAFNESGEADAGGMALMSFTQILMDGDDYSGKLVQGYLSATDDTLF